MTKQHELITGGAGFIGTNLADRLAGQGRPVTVFDNFTRAGVEANARWLQSRHGDGIRVLRADVRDTEAVNKAVRNAASVYHLAAQVAVTTSLADPIQDFEVNARGTLNVLEAVRREAARERRDPPFFLYTSTNKVLGGLERVSLVARERRYEPAEERIRKAGIGEEQGIEFCSPYGCSKGAADQYVLDYARCFGMDSVVFRMSCIYGPHQCGNEDQGWVAHFIKQALSGRTITLYGDGRQVRDALYVEDLIDAFLVARELADVTRGQAFNIGGGPKNTVSLLELIDLIGELQGRAPKIAIEEWRLSDQRYYVSDIGKFRGLTGWSPKVPVADGVARLNAWLAGNALSYVEAA